MVLIDAFLFEYRRTYCGIHVQAAKPRALSYGVGDVFSTLPSIVPLDSPPYECGFLSS